MRAKGLIAVAFAATFSVGAFAAENNRASLNDIKEALTILMEKVDDAERTAAEREKLAAENNALLKEKLSGVDSKLAGAITEYKTAFAAMSSTCKEGASTAHADAVIAEFLRN